MNCLKCHNEAEPGKALCLACMNRPRQVAPLFAPKVNYEELDYAGFFLRILANIIDTTFIGLLQGVFSFSAFLLFVDLQPGYSKAWIENQMFQGNISPFITIMTVALLVSLFSTILFYAVFDASRMRGPLGKYILGLEVADENGYRISFMQGLIRSTARSLPYFLPAFLLVLTLSGKPGSGFKMDMLSVVVSGALCVIYFVISHLLPLFSIYKQTLHDKAAQTVVLKGPNYSNLRLSLALFLAVLLIIASAAIHYFEKKDSYRSRQAYVPMENM